MRQFPAILALLLACCSCTQDRLTLQTLPVTYEQLASYSVGSPDPRKICPDIGQRLIATWSIPPSCMGCEETVLSIDIRYECAEEQTINVPLDRKTGMYTYYHLNEDFENYGGITTFRGRIFADGELIEEWDHQIWAEVIELDSDS